MKRVLIALFVLSLSVSLSGCASQQEIDSLKAQVAALKQAQQDKTAAEQAQQDAKAAAKARLAGAIDVADTDRLNCAVRAEKERNACVTVNGTPDPKHPGFFTGNKEAFDVCTKQEKKDDDDCQKNYDNTVQRLRITYE